MNIDLSKVPPDETMSISARDRRFFTQLIRYMDVESEKVGPNPSRERFSVFRLSFEKIIEQSSLYRPLFRAIKQEYEQCINVLELGADEVKAMSADLHRLVLQPKTFLLRQKRCMELEDKLAIIEQENRQIQREIDNIREEMKEQEKEEEIPLIQIRETPRTNSIKARTAHRRIPGMTLNEEMDLKLLDKYHDFIRIKYATFEQTLPSKYTNKEKRFEMQRSFEQKQIELDKERETRLVLRNRLRLYHLALRTIQKYIDDEINSSSSSNTDQILLEDAILHALYKSLNLFATDDQNEDEDFDSASTYDREAGALLNHIEIFMDLMERGNYKDASYIAACSPKGVLRNMETLLRFKGMKKPNNEEISPWLFHCRVLAETALEVSAKPDKLISLECAKAASSENQLNMLYKWIREDRLTISYEMAEIAEQAEAYDLAQFIYQLIGAHYQVATCLLKTDSSKRCLDYLMSTSESISTIKDHLTKLFHQYPSVAFAVNIIKYSSNKYFQADELVLFFLQLDQHMNAMEFVEILLKDNEMNSEKEQAEKLKTCFELLKKYSYLADNHVSKSSRDEEKKDGYETEQELAHRLTRRITRSALDRFRRTRRCSTTSIPTLEPIFEHPSTPPPLTPQPSASTEMSLCHQDFFNDFPGMLYFTEDVELKTDDTRSID